MNLNEINWDFNEAGNWPISIKVAAIVLVSIILIGGWVYFDTVDQWNNLEKAEKKEQALKKNI